MVFRPRSSATFAHAVLTELVSASLSVMSPKSSPPKFCSGVPEITWLFLPLIVESGVYLPESSAAVAVTVFIVEPGGKRPCVARLKVLAFFGSFGLYDGVAASTRTAPVLTSSATTAPGCPARLWNATSWARGTSVVRRSSPTSCGPSSRSSAPIASLRRPVSASL